MKNYDVIVIGSGPGGSKVADKCAAAGKKTAIIDVHFGGTCALRGCTPKKAMEAVASTLATARLLCGHGAPSKNDYRVRWEDLQKHRKQFTEDITKDTIADFKKKGIKVIRGEASFTGKNTLRVGKKKYSAEHIVAATGAMPRPLDFPGSKHLLYSEDFIYQDKLPKKIVFAGGGYIGFEMSHIAAACGAKVVIVSDDAVPLPQFDPEITKHLIAATEDKGISVRKGFKVVEIKKQGKSYTVIAENEDGETQKIKADAVYHAAGRVPRTKALKLKKAGVKTDDSGAIITAKTLRSKSNNRVWAVGDVTGKVPLTPAAEVEGSIVVKNILKGKKARMDYAHFPSVLFTHPKLASVGKTAAELDAAGTKYQIIETEITDTLTERAYHSRCAAAKIFLDKKGEKILGAHLIGQHAHETINLFATAMQHRLIAKDIVKLRLGYPTAGNAVRRFVTE